MIMADCSDKVLWYASKPKRWTWLRAVKRRTWIRLAITATVCVGAFAFVCGPTSGEIRIDTGDLRYCWRGVPLEYRRMPEPERSSLFALASRHPAVPAQWATCVRYPKSYTNNPDFEYRGYYREVAIWAEVDPMIARWAMEDVADHIEKRATRNFYSVLSFRVVDQGKVNPDWRDMEAVKDYCLQHGYVPPPPPPSPLNPTP